MWLTNTALVHRLCSDVGLWTVAVSAGGAPRIKISLTKGLSSRLKSLRFISLRTTPGIRVNLFAFKFRTFNFWQNPRVIGRSESAFELRERTSRFRSLPIEEGTLLRSVQSKHSFFRLCMFQNCKGLRYTIKSVYRYGMCQSYMVFLRPPTFPPFGSSYTQENVTCN